MAATPKNKLKEKATKENRKQLCSVVREFRLAKNASQQLADAQKKAAECLLKWSLGENNRAIKDLAFQLNELVCLWGDKEVELGAKVYEIMKKMDTVLDSYKILKDSKKNVDKCMTTERRFGKELKNAQRWHKGGEVRLREQKLEQAVRDRLLAEKSYSHDKGELEAQKMLQLKDCALQLAQCHLRHASDCGVLFSAARDIAAHSPDPSAHVASQRFDSSPRFSNDRVDVARAELRALDISSPRFHASIVGPFGDSSPSSTTSSAVVSAASAVGVGSDGAAATSTPTGVPSCGGRSSMSSRLVASAVVSAHTPPDGSTVAMASTLAALYAAQRGVQRQTVQQSISPAIFSLTDDDPPPPYNPMY